MGARFAMGFMRIQTTERIEVAATYTTQEVDVTNDTGETQVDLNLSTGFNQSTDSLILTGTEGASDDFDLTADPDLSMPLDAIVVNLSTSGVYFPEHL